MYIGAFFQSPGERILKRLLFANAMQTSKTVSQSPDPETTGALHTVPAEVITFNQSKLDFFPQKNKGNVFSRIYTVLFYSVDKTWNNVFKMIDQGADINTRDENGDGLLAYAVFYNRPDYLEELIKRGARLDMKNNDGLTLLEQLCSYRGTNYKNTFDVYTDYHYYLSKNFSRLSYEFRQFHECESIILNAVKVLLKHDRIKNQQIAEDMFERAINIRDFELANIIHEKYSIDINKKDARGKTLLHRYLMDYNDIGYGGGFWQTNASRFFGIRPTDSFAIRYFAIESFVISSNKNRTIRFLCNHGADIFAVDNAGQTPFEIAEKTDKKIVYLFDTYILNQ